MKEARSVNCNFDKDFCGWTVVEPELQRRKQEGVYVSQGIFKVDVSTLISWPMILPHFISQQLTINWRLRGLVPGTGVSLQS